MWGWHRWLSHYFNTGSCKTYVQGNYKIEGIGRSFLPGTLDFSLINAFVQVNGAESAEACHEYYHHTGFAPGFSSGAVIAAFKKLKDALKPDDQVVLFFADNGDRYRSKLYNPEWLRSNIFDEQTWSSFIKHYYTKPLSYV